MSVLEPIGLGETLNSLVNRLLQTNDPLQIVNQLLSTVTGLVGSNQMTAINLNGVLNSVIGLISLNNRLLIY